MDCPRCDRALSRYALSGSDNSAAVCESCGFVGVSTSHRIDRVQPESWDAVVDRIETDLDTLEFGQQRRTDGQQLPGSSEPSDSTLDGQRLEETVSVGVALADRDRDAEDRAGDADTGPDATGDSYRSS